MICCFFQLMMLRFVVKSEQWIFRKSIIACFFVSPDIIWILCKSFVLLRDRNSPIPKSSPPPSLARFLGRCFSFQWKSWNPNLQQPKLESFPGISLHHIFLYKHVLHFQVWLVIKARIPGKQICNPEQMRAKRIEKKRLLFVILKLIWSIFQQFNGWENMSVYVILPNIWYKYTYIYM